MILDGYSFFPHDTWRVPIEYHGGKMGVSKRNAHAQECGHFGKHSANVLLGSCFMGCFEP